MKFLYSLVRHLKKTDFPSLAFPSVSKTIVLFAIGYLEDTPFKS